MAELDRQRDIFTVSRLNMEVRSALEGSFPLLWISGEISNLAMPRSGHIYFSLKDSQAQVRAALFRNKRNYLRFAPENGMQVIVRARVTLYEPRGDYQLIIEQMEMAGEGALRQQVEQLRQKLDAEGLFDAAAKQEIPPFPASVGVMTSASGAALHDVISVMQRRSPMTRLIIYPVTVQGAEAAAEMTRMVQLIGKRNECNLLIVTRGGGSFEDLMPFNDEQLVRSIGQLPMPVISAVGHEVDTSLCDYVADQRAATPSAAAELACPDQRALLQQLQRLQQRHSTALSRTLMQLSQTVDYINRRIAVHHPGRKLQQIESSLHQQQRRLELLARSQLQGTNSRLAGLRQRLLLQAPGRRLVEAREQLERQQTLLHKGINRQLALLRQRFVSAATPLHLLSPLATLDRGYAIAFDTERLAVRDAATLSEGDWLNLKFASGEAECRVEKVKTRKN